MIDPRPQSVRRRAMLAASAVLLVAAFEAPAAPPAAEAYQSECGECHLAFPPRLLPRASWQMLMSGLDSHFGVDASLDADATRTISAWLEQSADAARRDRHEGREERRERATRELQPATGRPVLRITETPWFRHEHDEVSAATWKLASIGSPSNCGACHTDAARGRFDEDAIRIPKK